MSGMGGFIMLQGICINAENSNVLIEGKQYFLFPNGPKYFYVSRFPQEGAHTGCFEASQFKVSADGTWQPEPSYKHINLDADKTYKAQLIWRAEGYKSAELKGYYIKPRKTHGTFYEDCQLQRLGGCFPLHWFDQFEELAVPEIAESEIIEPEIAKYEQLNLFEL